MCAAKSHYLAVLLAVCVTVCSGGVCQAATQRLDADSIKAALRTQTLEEDGFVDRVLEKIRSGELCEATFFSAFLHARSQPRHKFQYFKQGLMTRTADNFDPPPPPPQPSLIPGGGIGGIFSSTSWLVKGLKRAINLITGN